MPDHTGQGERKILGNALVIAAIIYVVFAVIWGNTTWLLIEVIGVFVYGVFAWAAIRYSAYWLAIGWLLHPIWDVALHLSDSGNMVAPEWYAVGCITFDILIAAYVFYRVTYWQQHIARYNKSLSRIGTKDAPPG